MRRTLTLVALLLVSLVVMSSLAVAGGTHHELTPANCPDHITVTVHRLNDGRLRVGLLLRADGGFVPDYVYVAIGDAEKPDLTTQVALSPDQEDADALEAIVWLNDEMYQDGRFEVIYRHPDPPTATDIRGWTIEFSRFPIDAL